MATKEQMFFSRNPGMVIQMAAGEWKLIEGTNRRVGERFLRFTPQDDKYGRYLAKEDDEIEFLKKRATEIGDVLTAAEYNRELVPVAQQVQDSHRELAEANRLIAQLQSQLSEAEGGKGQRASK